MNANINKYLKLHTALVNEKAKIEARLTEITKVLGGGSVAASVPKAAGGKRTFTEATKAKMRAAQKARWAKIKGKVDSAAAPAALVVLGAKKKRKMSAAGRAAIVIAAKARWAKVKAQKSVA